MQLVRKPGMIGPMHAVPQLKAKVDWGHYTVEQKHALGRKIPQTHGKVLGGSSSINGMVFVRGNRKNFDDWAAEGNAGRVDDRRRDQCDDADVQAIGLAAAADVVEEADEQHDERRAEAAAAVRSLIHREERP